MYLEIMQQKAFLAFFVLVFSCTAWASDEDATAPNFVETGECQDQQICSYSYSAQQQHLEDSEQQFTEISATVDVTCTSNGVYNGSEAKLYCMELKNAKIASNMFENSTDKERRAIQQSLNELLQNWFCFVQTSSGKIPAVYHPTSEPDHAVSLKKAVAAAFQANFKGTDEEDEDDPQSRHKSHYIYTPTDENGLLKMRREVRKSDIRDFSSSASKDDIDTSKDEEIEYRDGKLQRSSGNTSFHLVNDSDSHPDSDTPSLSLSQTLSGSGSYNMELQTCRRVGRFVYRAEMRKILADIRDSSNEEGLTAKIDKKRESIEQMKTLRKKLPFSSALKALETYESFGDKLFEILQMLIELESEYGALPPYTPVIDDIITFMKMPAFMSDVQMRDKIIMLLSREGSEKSQMALLSVYQSALNEIEANSILIYMSFLDTVSLDFVIGYEELFEHSNEDIMLNDQLLLVFGSLAVKGSEEVEIRVMSNLRARVVALDDEASRNLTETKLLLHALGNTGSRFSISLIMSVLDGTSMEDYSEVKLTVIEAMAKVTDSPVVLAQFESFLEEDSSADTVDAIVETLHDGFEYIQQRNQDIEEYINTINSHTLVYSLAEAVSSINSTDLHAMMVQYLSKIRADEAIFDLIYGSAVSRGKRNTDDWDATNSDYNYVDSLVNRQNDVNTYNRHNAYITAKTIGIDEANIKLAYGYFCGTNTHCDRFKTYGRFIVVGKLLSHTSTLADLKLSIVITSNSASVVVLAKIKSNTLVDYSFNEQLSSRCLNYNRNLAQFNARLLTLTYNLYVYIGYLTLNADLDISFDLDVNAEVCIGTSGTDPSEAEGALTPTVGVTVSGGVSGNILELVRGGITVSVSLNYRLEPVVNVQACTAYCSLSVHTCIGLYDSFPSSNVRLETWYQTRSLTTCGSGWFTYPCFDWGSRHTWDALSRTWDLGSQARRLVRETCRGELHPLCLAGSSDPVPTSLTAVLSPTWPQGTYSFPKTNSDCPSAFAEGTVFQDNEDSANANSFSNTGVLCGTFGGNIQMCYCTKQSSSGSDSWPSGQYCVAKKGSCPSGFSYGYLYWDDEDSGNINSVSGVLPDGSYDRNTRVDYCCRNDGSRSTPIRLPTSTPFVLYPYGSSSCQQVVGMTASSISIYFDDEDSSNANSCSGSHPYDSGCGGRNHHLFLCYYR